jgi:hypothetical protein
LPHAEPGEQVEECLGVGCGDEGDVTQVTFPELVMVVDLSVEEEDMSVVDEWLVAIARYVQEAQPVMYKTRMLVKKIPGMVRATVEDYLPHGPHHILVDE